MLVMINERKIPVADSWNELTLNQQLFCYQCLMTEFGFPLTTEEQLPFQRIQIMKYLLGIDDRFLEQWKVDCLKDDPELGDIAFHSEVKKLSDAVTNMLLEAIVEEGENEITTYQISLSLT